MAKKCCFDDQAMMTDALDSQKMIAQEYNHYACECSTKQRKDKLMKLLAEEHDMQFDLYTEMHKRGWYDPKQAKEEAVCEACQQFEEAQQQL